MARVGNSRNRYWHRATEEEFHAVERGELRALIMKDLPPYEIGDDLMLFQNEKTLLCEVTNIITDMEGLKKGYTLVLFERPFRAYKESEMKKNRERYCEKCKYRGTLGSGKPIMCNYLAITGHRRQCTPYGCRRFVKGPMLKENQIKEARREEREL